LMGHRQKAMDSLPMNALPIGLGLFVHGRLRLLT